MNSITKASLKLFWMFLLFCCFNNLALAQSAGEESGLNQIKEQKCFLWKAHGVFGNSVYLLGSIHFASPQLFPLNKKIERAFEQAAFLVVEVDVNQQGSDQVQEMMLEKGLYRQGDSLSAHISPQTYQLAQKEIQELGLDIELLSAHKPWLISMELTSLMLQSLGYTPEFGIDKYFLNRAQGSKKILALESFDFQIRLFDDFSDYYQDLLLFYTIVDLESLEKEITQIITAWNNGDIDTMQAILSESLIKYPKIMPVYEKLIYSRNQTMFKKIEQYFGHSEDYFVVVGAAHLIGPQGIISLLKQNGYAVEQL